MPLLNWQALKPNQVSGTVFSELDDEHVLEVRLFATFSCFVFLIISLFRPFFLFSHSLHFSPSQELNMDLFAEKFKTKAQGPPADLSSLKVKVTKPASTKVSLMDTNKAKNLAITLRKGGMSPGDICTAIET